MGSDDRQSQDISHAVNSGQSAVQGVAEEQAHATSSQSAHAIGSSVVVSSSGSAFESEFSAKRAHRGAAGVSRSAGGDNADRSFVNGYGKAYSGDGSGQGIGGEGIRRRDATVRLGGRTISVVTSLTQQQLEEVAMMVESHASRIGGRRGVTQESIVMAAVALANELKTHKAREEWLGNRLEELTLAHQRANKELLEVREQLIGIQERSQKLQQQSQAEIVEAREQSQMLQRQSMAQITALQQQFREQLERVQRETRILEQRSAAEVAEIREQAREAEQRLRLELSRVQQDSARLLQDNRGLRVRLDRSKEAFEQMLDRVDQALQASEQLGKDSEQDV